jgi:hypothetical protein
MDNTADHEQLQQCAEQLAADFLPEGWRRVHSSAYTKVACHRAQQLYFKEFLPRSPAATGAALLKGSRAKRVRNNNDILADAGIDAPRNISWGTLPGGREYLFSSALPGRGIDTWLRELRPGSGAEARTLRRTLLRSLGTFVGRIHATGFIFGDLHPRNVLADLQQGRFRFYLVDAEQLRRQTPPPGTLLLTDLVQLNALPLAGKTDRLRTFLNWQRQMRELTPVEARVLAAQVLRNTSDA